MDEAAAQSLGKYRPIALLGQGGMARVLLTVAEGPAGVQKLLVVKEIRPELAKDTEFVTMFMDEARLAARLNHPNLIQTYEVGDHDGRPFIVMEYLEGQPLHALLGRAGRPNVPQSVQLTVISKVLSGLHYAHELKGFDGAALEVVHRDVSPQNVFVCYDGQVKLVDFGIAKAAGSVARTQTGVFKGKLGYVAPEQITSSVIDRRADLFGVGVMLWETLAKRRLTQGEGEAAVLHKRTHGAEAKIQDVAPDAPPDLAEVCARAMALSPEERFATAAEMQAALDRAIDKNGLRASDGEIGSLVARVFAPERDKIRSVLETQLAAPPPTSTLRTGMLPTLARPDESLSVPPAATQGVSVTPPSINTGASMEVVFPQRRFPVAWVAGGATIAGLAALLVFVAVRGGGAAAASSTPSSSALGSSAPPAPSIAAPDSVELTVTVHPSSAQIAVDGVPVSGNPFRGGFVRDAKMHKVTVWAPGYAAQERGLTFERDAMLDLSLTKQQAQVSGTQVAPVATPSAWPGADPGTDLKPAGKKPTHAIDEKDPY